MSKIILINGACGIGKSTISKLLHKNLNFSFLFARDEERRKISNYKKDENNYNKSGIFINQILFSIIKTYIENNENLVIDAVFYDKEIIRNIEEIVKNKGNFYHIYLFAEKSIWKNRLLERGFSGSLTLEKAEKFYTNLGELEKEVDMIKIDTSNKNEEKIIEKILNIL